MPKTYNLSYMYKVFREHKTQIKDANTLNEYLYGGKGVVELVSPSGKKHDYLFAKPTKPNFFPEDVMFVYALHEDKTLFYIGMLEKGNFKLTKSSRFLPDTEIVQGAEYIIKLVKIRGLIEKSRMSVYHLGMCARCGRPLKGEKQLIKGYGKKCYRKQMLTFAFGDENGCNDRLSRI